MFVREEVKKIEVSVIRKIAEKMDGYENTINLTIGEPDVEINAKIREDLAYHALNSHIKYSPVGGWPILKKKIAKFYNEQFNCNYNEKNVVVTVGTTEGISSTLRSILEEGDEVIVPTPAYVGYDPLISFSKAKTIFLDLREKGFYLTAEDIEKNITNKTKAIILTYPNNPSGMILEESEMKKIVEVVKKHEIYLISDEIYGLLANDNYVSFGKFYDEIKEKLIVVNGFSKSHSMTGYRIGFILLNENLQNEIKKVSQYTIASPSTLSQYGAMSAIDNCPDVSKSRDIYQARIKFFIEELKKIGFESLDAQGGFYVFASYEKIEKLKGVKSYDFVMDLLEKTGLGIVPGSCFMVEGYVRFSLIFDIPVLKEVLNRLKSYIENL